LRLFKKPEVEITFDKANIKPAEAWPFPVKSEKPKKQAKKPVVRKPAVKKTVVKKATKVVKKVK
jgi:hypothetical protein